LRPFRDYMGGSSAGLRSFDHRCGSQNAASFAAAARAPGPGARRINQRAWIGAVDSARRTVRATPGRSRRSIPSRTSIPRQVARAASVSASPSGRPTACVCEPARDRAGDGDELIGRCGHGRSCGAPRHCLGAEAFRQPLPSGSRSTQASTRRRLAWAASCASRRALSAIPWPGWRPSPLPRGNPAYSAATS
jgi:hypothetical protein